MLVKEFSGKSEKDAVNKALEELNLTESRLSKKESAIYLE